MLQTIRAISQTLSVQRNVRFSVLTQRKGSPGFAHTKFSRTITTGHPLTFEGVLAPVYTPFTADGEKIVLNSIPKYSKYLASKGIKGVLVNGTNGEGMVMTASERASVTEAWVAAGHSDNLHVQSNIGGTNIKDAISLAKHAETCGADSLLSLPELYYKPQTVPALVEYIKKIAEAAPTTPILYYHIPAVTNVSYLNLTELLTRAGKEIPTFAGIKFTDGDLILGSACANWEPEKFKIFIGANEILSGAYLLGFKSATAAAANMFPELCLALVSAVNVGRLQEAKEKQSQLNKAIKDVAQNGNRIACFKAATELISGVPLGPTRFPIPSLDSQAKEKLRKSLIELCAI